MYLHANYVLSRQCGIYTALSSLCVGMVRMYIHIYTSVNFSVCVNSTCRMTIAGKYTYSY